MNKPDAWMPLYIGDYLADTVGLTAEQHGAYLLLIMAYWRLAAALPDDDGRLARIACMTPSQWKRNRATIAAFFVVDGGLWHHKRIDAELAAASEKRAKAQASAHARWQGDRNANASADASKTHMPTQCSEPSPSPSYQNLRSRVQPSARGNGAKPLGGGPLDTSDEGPMAALVAENRRRNKAGQPPMNAEEIAAWKAGQGKAA